MVNLWCKAKNLYGESMVNDCIVVSLVPSPRHLIWDLLVLDDGSANIRSIYDRGSIIGSSCFFTV